MILYDRSLVRPALLDGNYGGRFPEPTTQIPFTSMTSAVYANPSGRTIFATLLAVRACHRPAPPDTAIASIPSYRL